MQIGVVMSGRLRFGASEFFYLDTRAALGGSLLEVIVAHDLPLTSTEAPPIARFDLDFTNRV